MEFYKFIFIGSWEDCIHVIRLHHICHPESTIAEQARRNNLKGLFMVRVSTAVKLDKIVSFALTVQYTLNNAKHSIWSLEFTFQ